MGKLIDILNKQLLIKDKEQNAKDCIIIYNKIKEITGGVSSHTWQVLTKVTYKGYPSSEKHYAPSIIGKIFLNGIKKIKKD